MKTMLRVLSGALSGGLGGFLISLLIFNIFPGLITLLAGKNNGGWNHLAEGIVQFAIVLILTIIGLLLGGYLGNKYFWR